MKRMPKGIALGFFITVAGGAAMAETAEAPSGSDSGTPYTVIDGTKVDARTHKGWEIVTALDCGRCHGKEYRGRVGPSLLESARERSKSGFQYYVLEGMPMRGMPGYKHYEKVRNNIDGIYGYFKGLADGAIQHGELTKINESVASQED